MLSPYIEIKSHLVELFTAAVQQVCPEPTDVSVEMERPRDAAHGDYACSIAMKLAKTLRRNPRELATLIHAALPASAMVAKTEIAGAGFINVYLHPAAHQQIVPYALSLGANFGNSQMGAGKKVQVEFVSANPTGPLHVGHGRGAAYGASLANVLAAAGYTVEREYYVNDAGRQMDILTISTWIRYLTLCGENVTFPVNAYKGDYVNDMARIMFDQHGTRYLRPAADVFAKVPDIETLPDAHLDGLIINAKALLGADYHYVHDLVLTEQLGDGRNDLQEFGVEFDEWFSEQSLYDSGVVQRIVAQLEANGHIYEQDGAKWFRSTHFGDEKDRVVLRDNGQYTYFASDIAYHINKLERGFDIMIDVWGADHHGYIPRVKGALQALNLDPDKLVVALVQFAILYRDGKKASMSTRSGEFVTLRELRKEVGNDAARFFYVLRKSDQHLDFDLDLAKSQTSDNPVYYIQYAHARICSVLTQWGGDANALANIDCSVLTTRSELELMQQLASYPAVLEMAARDLAPHAIAYALKDIAAALHGYYNAEQFLVEDEALRHARMALITATRFVLQRGLALLGVTSPTQM
ncbi:arginine--tRNA ligase [Sulfuriferula nivalis]|uniref:Arginine--tRNA ligase n=1 Tax=Sulfuriferula nivalis TaxID=2675298 RepID=A0A809SFU2_9PROT|nr:arginine--tRNA ligase [Sulfuriferula nivalis]BBO99339.1 arginine--tRNA ligase [Sulfuriferula nivalis]